MAHPEVTLDYTSPSADSTSFGNGLANNAAPARWIQCYGAGTIVATDNGSTPANRTYVVTGSEILTGEWSALVSTTCSRIRMGTSWPPPPAMPFPAPVNLAGGSAAVNGVLPAANAQRWADIGTVYAAAFAPTPANVHPFNFQSTAAITFPKITAAINGQGAALFNMGTGATASTLFPTGTDSIGPQAQGVTAATAVGPKSQVAIAYTANLTLGQWVPTI